MRKENCFPCPAQVTLACLEHCLILSTTESMQSPVQNIKKMRESLGSLAENLGLNHSAQETGKAPLSGILLAKFFINLRSESNWIRDADSKSKLPPLFQALVTQSSRLRQRALEMCRMPGELALAFLLQLLPFQVVSIKTPKLSFIRIKSLLNPYVPTQRKRTKNKIIQISQVTQFSTSLKFLHADRCPSGLFLLPYTRTCLYWTLTLR